MQLAVVLGTSGRQNTIARSAFLTTSLPWKDWEQKTELPHVPLPPPPPRFPMHYLTRIPFFFGGGEFWKRPILESLW